MGQMPRLTDEHRHDGNDERQTAWSAGLKAKYDEVAQDPVPDKFRELLEQLEDAEAGER